MDFEIPYWTDSDNGDLCQMEMYHMLERSYVQSSIVFDKYYRGWPKREFLYRIIKESDEKKVFWVVL